MAFDVLDPDTEDEQDPTSPKKPPRRIGELTPYPLNRPPQRHHPDPAASRDEIRTLPNIAIPKNNRVQAEPDRGDTGAEVNTLNVLAGDGGAGTPGPQSGETLAQQMARVGTGGQKAPETLAQQMARLQSPTPSPAPAMAPPIALTPATGGAAAAPTPRTILPRPALPPVPGAATAAPLAPVTPQPATPPIASQYPAPKSYAQSVGLDDTAFWGRVANAVGGMANDPVGVVTAPVKAAWTLSKWQMEQDASNWLRVTGGDPTSLKRTVSNDDARDAALMLGGMAVAGPLGKTLGEVVGRVAGTTAQLATRTAAAAGGGAMMSPQDPLVGATLGAPLGVLHASEGEAPTPEESRVPKPHPALSVAPEGSAVPDQVAKTATGDVGVKPAEPATQSPVAETGSDPGTKSARAPGTEGVPTPSAEAKPEVTPVPSSEIPETSGSETLAQQMARLSDTKTESQPEGRAQAALRGDEFGEAKEGVAAVRQRATEFAKENLIGRTFRNEATGWDVNVPRAAIDHTTHPETMTNWHASMLALHSLPDLIRGGEHATTEATIGSQDKIRDVPAHHRLRAQFSVAGQPYTAEMTLREARQLGAKRLYHVKAITIEPGEAAEQPSSRVLGSGSQPPSESSGSEGKVSSEPSPSQPGTGEIEHRNLGLSLPPGKLKSAKLALSEAVTEPNARIVTDHPELARAISSANAMTPTQAGTFARQIAERAVAKLTPEQRRTFGQRVILDNFEAEANRKTKAATAAEADHQTRITGLNALVAKLEADQASLRATRRASTKEAEQSAGKAATQRLAAATAKQSAADIQARRDELVAPGATHADLVTAVGEADEKAGNAKSALDAAVKRRRDVQKSADDAARRLESANRAVATINDRVQRMQLNEDGTPSTQMGDLPSLMEERARRVEDGNAALADLQRAHEELPVAHSDVERLTPVAQTTADRHADLREAYAQSREGAGLPAEASAATARAKALRMRQRIAETASRYTSTQIEHGQRAAREVREGIRRERSDMQENVGALRQAAKNHTTHADALRAQLPAGLEQQPWFKKALAAHTSTVQPFLDKAAAQAGVDVADFRKPSLGAYLRLVPQERINEPLIRRAQSIAAGEGEGATTPRTGLTRRLIGQKRGVLASSPAGTESPMQGPVDVQRESSVGGAGGVAGTKQSGSAKMATGAARTYSTDYLDNVQYDAADKVSKAAHNQVFNAIAKDAAKNPTGEAGKIYELTPDKNAPPGMRVIAFNDSKELVDPPPASTEMSAKIRRFAVPKDVGDAVDRYRQKYTYPSAAGRTVRGALGAVTRSVLLNPGVAATHSLTLASSVGTGIPADAVMSGAATALPGVKTISTLARMRGVDFNDPAIAQRLTRLAFNGALRLGEDKGGGLLDAGHHFLFGPKGMDTRARVVASQDVEAGLRKAGITPDDPRFAGMERKYVVEHAGNYVSRNQGTAAKWLQDNGIAPFIAINRAKLGVSLKALVGSDGTIEPSAARRLGVAVRGPLGASAGIAAAGYLLSGHGPNKNAPGHEGDMATGVYHAPDGSFRYFRGDPADAVSEFGRGTKEVYLRRGLVDQPTEAALRVLQPLVTAHSGDRLHDALRASVNTGLQLVGPGVGAAWGLATGKSMYMGSDDNFTSVDEKKLPGQKDDLLKGRLIAAARNANAAASLVLPPQGDQPKASTLLGRPLVNAFAEANPIPGTGSERAQVNEWIDSKRMAIMREPDRAKREALMADAMTEAGKAGYAGARVRQELQKAVNVGGRNRSGAAEQKFNNRIRSPSAADAYPNPFTPATPARQLPQPPRP